MKTIIVLLLASFIIDSDQVVLAQQHNETSINKSHDTLILPDGIEFDSTQKLAIDYPNIKYIEMPINENYKFQLINPHIVSKINSNQINCISRLKYDRSGCEEINNYILKDSTLSVIGGFPIKFISQLFSDPVSIETAQYNASLISNIDFSKPYITQKDRELYADNPLGETSIILNSCLFNLNDHKKVDKITCVFSTP